MNNSGPSSDILSSPPSFTRINDKGQTEYFCAVCGDKVGLLLVFIIQIDEYYAYDNSIFSFLLCNDFDAANRPSKKRINSIKF